MTDQVIYDASFGHAQITPAALKPTAAGGVILYAGCRDSRKNTTRAEIAALLAAGYQVGLVIENNATDAIGGAAVGTAQGKAIVAAAKALGYDWQNCVLFGGYDTDSHAGDWPELLAYEKAFARQVPVPGYYGDSDSIDYLHGRGSVDWIFWQSDSRAFSPLNPTPNAHLLQLFNDPRAHGLPVDVDLVKRTPLRLMGEDMTTAADVWDFPITDPNNPNYKTTAASWLAHTNDKADQAIAAAKAATAAATALAAQVKQLQAQVTTLTTVGVDPAALAKALAPELAAHIDLTAK